MLFAAINVIIELLNIGDVPLLGVTFADFNTGDIVDALFGVAAVLLIGGIYLKRTK